MANAHCIDNKSLFNFSNAIWVHDNDDENSLQLWMIRKKWRLKFECMFQYISHEIVHITHKQELYLFSD